MALFKSYLLYYYYRYYYYYQMLFDSELSVCMPLPEKCFWRMLSVTLTFDLLTSESNL